MTLATLALAAYLAVTGVFAHKTWTLNQDGVPLMPGCTWRADTQWATLYWRVDRSVAFCWRESVPELLP